MSPYDLAYLLAIGSNLSFSSASILFTKFTKEHGVIWMNSFKSYASLIMLLLTVPLFFSFKYEDPMSIYGLLLSGVVGLGIGDFFLFYGFKRIGPSRTLMLFSFQPIFMAAITKTLFNQSVEQKHIIAILFMVLCLYLFSLEGKKKTGQWEVVGLIFALLGVCLDTTGIIISRVSFDKSPSIDPMWGHTIRTIGSSVFYILINLWRKKNVLTPYKQANKYTKSSMLMAVFLGTYLALFFYLNAIKIGHMAGLTAISITGPLFAVLLEHLIDKKLPSKILCLAFASFLLGMSCLILL